MTTYEYSCARCGRFEKQLAMGSAPGTHACPACGGEARRVYSPPGVTRVPASVAVLREREERSREAPEVVRRGKATSHPSRPAHPALARLPRP
ncbi:FmdB family zinc ribbon protein [Streptomyces thermodiastaticus]|uniref:FmdB family zinc ribbon protein n=1 Tax=Streptomyces thermodiastaticus TaxID=44061 RepID=UPI001671CBE0|nr:zinc ribbon domain-containing protein [Streptomyces thermodiastaticus]MCE7553012.1 zinc ribbon domain-containing protein [Streptomyces thermodiastaticus]GHF84665.1 hypothetical protein GCM10018787_36880 [Streptomyces thermodiastaticus]